jgi:hypothetical protein
MGDFIKLYLKSFMKFRIDGPYQLDEAANAFLIFVNDLEKSLT